MSGFPDGFRAMDPGTIRQILADRQDPDTRQYSSVLVEQQGDLERSLQEIRSQRCNSCSSNLVPRTPSDPQQVFDGSRMRYEGWCPACKVTVTNAR